MQPYGYTSANGKAMRAKHYSQHPSAYSTTTSDQEGTDVTMLADSDAPMSERSNSPCQQAALSNLQDGQKTSDDANLSSSSSNYGSSSPVCVLPATILYGSAEKEVSFGGMANGSDTSDGASEADRHGSEINTTVPYVTHKDMTTAHKDSFHESKPTGLSMQYLDIPNGNYVGIATANSETRQLRPPPKAETSAESNTAISVRSIAGSQQSALETGLVREEPLQDVRSSELKSNVDSANEGISRATTSRSDVTTEELDRANSKASCRVSINGSEDEPHTGIREIVKPMHDIATERGDNDADINGEEYAGKTKVEETCTESQPENINTLAMASLESIHTARTESKGRGLYVQYRRRFSEQYSDDAHEVVTGKHPENVSQSATPYAESVDPADTGSMGQCIDVQDSGRLSDHDAVKEVVLEGHHESVTTFARTYIESLLRTVGIKLKGKDLDRTVLSEQYAIEDTQSSSITIRLSKREITTSDSEGILRKVDESRHEQAHVATKRFSNLREQTEYSVGEIAGTSGMCSDEINTASSMNVRNHSGKASVPSDEMILTPAQGKPKVLHSGRALAAIWDLFERTKSRQSIATNAGQDRRSTPQLASSANPNMTPASRRNVMEVAEKVFGTKLTLAPGTTTERLRRGDRGIHMSISNESCLEHTDMSVENDSKAIASWQKLWGRAKELSATAGSISAVGQGSALPLDQSGEPHLQQAGKGATHGHGLGYSQSGTSSSSGDPPP